MTDFLTTLKELMARELASGEAATYTHNRATLNAFLRNHAEALADVVEAAKKSTAHGKGSHELRLALARLED